MRKINLIFIAVSSIMISGCNLYRNPSEVSALNTKIPFKDASLIKGAENKNNIIAAVEIPDSDMQYKLFSESIASDYLPVLITITNNSPKRVLFKNASLIIDNKEYKQASLVDVVESFQGHFWLTVRMFAGAPVAEAMNEKQRRDEAVNVNLYNKSMRESIILPNHTIQGFYFYRIVNKESKNFKMKLKFQKLNRIEYFDITVTAGLDKN